MIEPLLLAVKAYRSLDSEEFSFVDNFRKNFS